jgi:hypothetical protein
MRSKNPGLLSSWAKQLLTERNSSVEMHADRKNIFKIPGIK